MNYIERLECPLTILIFYVKIMSLDEASASPTAGDEATEAGAAGAAGSEAMVNGKAGPAALAANGKASSGRLLESLANGAPPAAALKGADGGDGGAACCWRRRPAPLAVGR
ncbi:Protein of unknown function [Gryllus bimaculatus]|nr:Protein of unknown function [Gryllus bimaculatus]